MSPPRCRLIATGKLGGLPTIPTKTPQATLEWSEREPHITVESVSVRFKGNSSSNPKQAHKRSFLVKFDASDKGRRFFGLRQVSFDNGAMQQTVEASIFVRDEHQNAVFYNSGDSNPVFYAPGRNVQYVKEIR